MWYYFYGKVRDPLDPKRPRLYDYLRHQEAFKLVITKNCELCNRQFNGNDAYLITTCQHVFCSCILEHYKNRDQEKVAECPICETFALRLRRFSKGNIGVRESITIPD